MSSLDKQKAIVDYITDYKLDNNGLTPTIRQIREHMGMSSTSVVSWHIDRLVERGVLIKRGYHYDITWGRWHVV